MDSDHLLFLSLYVLYYSYQSSTTITSLEFHPGIVSQSSLEKNEEESDFGQQHLAMESRKTVEGARDSASRNPLSFAARAFGSCFAPSFDTLPDKAAKPDTNNSQSSSSSSTSTAAPSLSGSSSHGRASTNRRSGKGMVLHSANTTTNTTSTNGRRSGKGMVLHSANTTTNTTSTNGRRSGKGMVLHSANTTTNPTTPSLSGSIYGGGSSHGRASTNSRRSGKGMMLHSAAAAAAAVTQPHQIGSLKFDMAEIQKATNNFSSSMKIGQGGFGTVFKGTLEDGTVVAIKRAKKNPSDSHRGSSEFQSEIKTLAQVEHLNLVRFLGYLEQDDERIVVVEYVPNGNLREHLDGIVHGRSQPQLDLAVRLDIAIDVAHAVTYLHMYTDHPIIHRDIKSSNILLTENLRAKVADFGFARMGATEGGMTHVSTQVKGTAGYLDPEYLKTYQLTDKSDVYSFGVLLVELISGRRPIEPKREHKERITPKWAIKNFADGNAIEVLDPNLDQNRATNLALEKMLELAFQCLAPTKQGRPSMRRCAEILWSIRKDYLELLASDSISHPSRQRKPPSIIKEK